MQLFNVTVFGNGHFGCSSVLSRHSTLGIGDSKFLGIQGSFGTAMMILESCVTFTGNNTFLNNAALIGGSLYFLMSVVILKGTNMFEDNYTFVRSEFRTLNCIYCNNNKCQKEVISSGGAIYSNYSTFIINSDISNNFAHTNGGAVFAQDGNIVIQDSTVLFDRNLARSEGGVMCLFFVTLILDGISPS